MAGPQAWDPARPGAAAGVGESVYSEALGAAICERVAAGETMSAVSRTAGMPERHTLRNWMRAHPDFGEALRSAMRAARLRQRAADQAALALMAQARAGERRGRSSTYRWDIAEAICERLSNGETLTSITRDPAMPCFGTVMAWVRRNPEFADLYAQARQAYADYLCDEARDVAQASTHETVWSDRLQFDSIRWAAARMAPRKYCERLMIDMEVAAVRRERDGELTARARLFLATLGEDGDEDDEAGAAP
jgi:transposase-like protein